MFEIKRETGCFNRNQIMQSLEEYLEENFESFRDVRSQYITVLETLRKTQGVEMSPSVDDLAEAIKRQTISNIVFSAALGLQANYSHFIDPTARTVVDVGFEVFLREDTARRLPEYEKAQAIIETFFSTLSTMQEPCMEMIMEYTSYLDTFAPKLAHYYGYILGNDLLYDLVPGYHLDNVLTMQYRSMLLDYLRDCEQPLGA